MTFQPTTAPERPQQGHALCVNERLIEGKANADALPRSCQRASGVPFEEGGAAECCRAPTSQKPVCRLRPAQSLVAVVELGKMCNNRPLYYYPAIINHVFSRVTDWQPWCIEYGVVSGPDEGLGERSTNMTLPARKPFELPASVTIVFYLEKDGRMSAHALEFDLVSTSDTAADALQKIRLSVRNYVEFGFLNSWTEDIRYPAPEKFWPLPGTELEVGEPITIMSRSLLVYSASPIAHESREIAAVA